MSEAVEQMKIESWEALTGVARPKVKEVDVPGVGLCHFKELTGAEVDKYNACIDDEEGRKLHAVRRLSMVLVKADGSPLVPYEEAEKLRELGIDALSELIKLAFKGDLFSPAKQEEIEKNSEPPSGESSS